jgi:hypothetical protein
MGELKDKFYQRVLRRKYKNFNSFGSHMPALIGLGITARLKNVLELGAGLNSTPVFLNRSCYPELNTFTSVENDLTWFDKLKSDPGFKGASNIFYYPGKIADYVKEIRNLSFDLILIDDSYETCDRVSTINAVFQMPLSDSAIVLIHDFETKEYQEAVKGWPYCYSFRSLLPNVGVVWKDNNLMNLAALSSINKTIERNKWALSIYDVNKWVHVFNAGK